MKSITKKTISVLLICCLTMFATSAFAVKAPKINTTKKTIKVGNTFLLKIKNANKKVKWSTNNKKVAKITAKGGKNSYKAKIKGLKSGKATITAKIGKKSLKCKITVKKKSGNSYSGGSTVYITATGEKYHSDGCSCLRRSKYSISLSKAKAQGYTACSLCHPPR